MKKFFLFILSILFFNCFLNAEEKLPVLKVSFPASTLPDSDYIQGEMILEDSDGSVMSLPAKFRTRGATAKQYRMKPSFNMKLESADGEELDTDLLGIRKASSWILDAMAIDRICMRNRVCFDIWNQYSKLPYETDFDSRNGTKGKFVIVYINNQYKGIYCLTDKINRKLLDLKKPKIEDDEVIIRGVLYKQGTQDIENQEIPGFYNDYMDYVAQWHDAWELKEPDDYPCPEAWSPLVEFYNNYRSSYVIDNFYDYNLIDYTLLIMALCITDNWGYKNKYFSMQNSIGKDGQKKFIVTPWDLDTSLGGHYNGDYYNGRFAEWSMQEIANSSLLPFSVCFSNQIIISQMKNRWLELRTGALSVNSVAGWLNEYCSLFEETGAWKEYVDFWSSKGDRPKFVTDLRAEINLIIEWYEERFEQMDKYFGITEAGIEKLEEETFPLKIFNLQGLLVDCNNLEKGKVYICNGKKIVWSGQNIDIKR